MKKGIFTTLVVFATLAMTACGAKTKCEKHQWGSYEVTVNATCNAEGKKVRTCKVCGEKEEQVVPKIDHKFGEWGVKTAGTCANPGVESRTCSACGQEETRPLYVEHTWGETPETVEGAADEASYNIFTCTVCGGKKIEFAAKQATGKSTVSGSLKSDSSYPDYMKLSDNDQYVAYKFNYAGTASTNARIYQRGVMDYWHDGNNDNQNRNYYSGKNNSDGNFQLTVNGENVDYSATKDTTYEQMLPGTYTGQYSPLGDCIIGSCKVNSGENTIKYTRKESYNLLIKDFVIILG